MSGEYEVDNIEGNMFMDEDEKEFFEKYSLAIERQEDIIAEQHEMKVGDKELDELLRNLENIKEEYVVQGALLGCTKGLSESRNLTCEGQEMESIPVGIEANSRIRINEVRLETISGLIPANIEDCKGGMRDAQDPKVNIISFGNCAEIENGADLRKLLNAAKLVEKEEEIKEAIKEGKGTCYCFMKLNNEWENLGLIGEYMTGTAVPCAGVCKAFYSQPYMRFNNKEGINMMSMLFCQYGGGIITAQESGQHIEMQNFLKGINNLKYKSGEIWSPEMIAMAKYTTIKMLAEGYSLEIIAGMVGNIVNEGNFGHLESSDYKRKSKPDYLEHMDKVHNYRELASGKNIFDIGTNVLVQLKKEGNCTSKYHGFGLGAVQWTYDRCEGLIKKYIDTFGENAFPTKKECAEVELCFMLEELSGGYEKVIIKCESETMNLDPEEKVKAIAKIIMEDYESPTSNDSTKREEAAYIWYSVLTGEDDE